MSTNIQPHSISGKLLSQLRIIKGYGQKQIAEKLHVTQQAYSKVEKKEVVKVALLEIILRAMDSSIDELEALERFINV